MGGKGLVYLRPHHIAVVALAALCCALAALAGGSASVADARTTVRPPVGTPDLSQMALLPTDLPSGTRVEHQGYVNEEGSVAAYTRVFGPARVGQARLISLYSEIALDKTADDASSTFFALKLVVGQKSARQRLAQDMLKTVQGQRSFSARKVTVDKPRNLRIGDGALVLPMTFYTSVGRIHAAIAFGVRHRADTVMFAVAAPGSRLTASDLAPLIAATSDHIHAGLLPINTAPPSVSGAAQLGQTLSAAPGAWSNRPASFDYQWQRCDANGTACVAIPGATGPTYNVDAADPGATLRVSVTAGNSVGQAMAITPQTPVVS